MLPPSPFSHHQPSRGAYAPPSPKVRSNSTQCRSVYCVRPHNIPNTHTHTYHRPIVAHAPIAHTNPHSRLDSSLAGSFRLMGPAMNVHLSCRWLAGLQPAVFPPGSPFSLSPSDSFFLFPVPHPRAPLLRAACGRTQPYRRKQVERRRGILGGRGGAAAAGIQPGQVVCCCGCLACRRVALGGSSD